MSGFGAKTYSKVGLQTDVISGDPHRLILILFDGALLSIQRARAHMEAQRISEKGNSIGHAIEVVDNGLRVSVDTRHDPDFAGRLISLYRYVTMRLLQANLRNDLAALDEAAKILGDLRTAWAKIAPSARAGVAAPAGVAATPAATVAATAAAAPARRVLSAYQA